MLRVEGPWLFAAGGENTFPRGRMKETPTIAVINSSEDTIEMLQVSLEQHGYSSVVAAHVADLRKGRVDFRSFLAAHDPRVLIYDISIPYDQNWEYLQELLGLEEMQGRTVVITTTNKEALEGLVGPTNAFEIHGKPYDIEQIVASVERALGAR